MKKLSVMITGATGMVGEAVLMQALQDDRIERILIVNRRSSGYHHPKLTEIIHENFFSLDPLRSRLQGYNACLFCLGVSSVGMKEDPYTSLTYTLTMHVAALLSQENAGMTFCYVSGAGTDGTEKGRLMWARVKGKTENDLLKLPFAAVYNFRPGMLIATPGQKFVLPLYKYFEWMVPLVKLVAPNSICSLQELGKAMLAVCSMGYAKNILEVKDIKAAAKY